MAEQIKSLGALVATTNTAFNLRDATVFGQAAHLDIRKMTFVNSSTATITGKADGIPFVINAQNGATVTLPGRGEFLFLNASATVDAGDLYVILEGEPLPIHRRA